jgi:hypothetical protein
MGASKGTMVLYAVNNGLRMFNPYPKGKGLGLNEYALFLKENKNISG